MEAIIHTIIGAAVITIASLPVHSQPLDLTRDCTLEMFEQCDGFIKQNAPSEDAFVAVQRVAARYIRGRQWEQASEVFKRYRPLFKEMDQRFARIIALLEADEEGLVVKNLGPNINTAAGEWDPTPTADGRFLYFTGYLRPDGPGRHDVFVSEFRNGQWQPAVSLGPDVNTTLGDETIDNITADGNTLLLSGRIVEGFGRIDVFYVTKTTTGWDSVRFFPSPINTRYDEQGPFITSDGKALLFDSDRPGSIGQFKLLGSPFHGDYWGNEDIYVSVVTDTGWSQPTNLGPTINTPFTEVLPFLHPDGKTLYFNSTGHYGLGRLDVFKAVRLRDDSWTEWSEPVNLGKEINTADNDMGYTVTTSGELAYYAAKNRAGGYGNWDIYSVTLPRIGEPDIVVTIRGKVTDSNGNPLAADVRWEDLTTGQNVGQLSSDPQDGSYFIALPLGKNYGYYAKVKGYYPTSSHVDLRTQTDALERTEDIVLVAIAQDTTVRINNVFFDFDKYELKSESHPELNRLARILKNNPEMKVEILGHTDHVGTEAYNLWLSEQRAHAVVDYLISVGCEASKLTAIGYGKSKPIASNETEEGRQKNRRVEFRVIQVTAIK
ncbi:MAG: OmpA family protein [bacterium]